MKKLNTNMRKCIAFALIAVLSTAYAAERPNIIVFMGDDVGCYGASTTILTTPSRYAMFTGQYSWRESGHGIAGPNATLLIVENRTCLADIFEAAGYTTAAIGKWHLDLGSGTLVFTNTMGSDPQLFYRVITE